MSECSEVNVSETSKAIFRVSEKLSRELRSNSERLCEVELERMSGTNEWNVVKK
jgi:hypothetical protein